MNDDIRVQLVLVENSKSLTTTFEFSTDKDYHLTVKMTSALVVKTSVAKSSPSQDFNHPYDLFQSRQIQYSLTLENNEGSFSLMYNSELKDVRR